MSQTLKVYAPYDRSLIREITMNDEKDIEKALNTAFQIAQNPGKRIPKYQRIEILEKLSQLMQNKQEELCITAAREGGKPYKDSMIEVIRAINGVKLAASELYALRGEEIPMGLTSASMNRWAFTIREPIGTVLAFSAFNHPLNLIVHQVVPAVASGCPVLVKPASNTPLTCLSFVEMLYESGLPEDYCRVLICDNQKAQKLASDERIRFFSFIGSAPVGWYLHSRLSPGTRAALEHGGVAPVIIDKNVETEEITQALLKGAYYHAGQVCVSVQKVFVHRDILDSFKEKLLQEIPQLQIGDPLDKNTDIGPLIEPQEVERVDTWVKEAVAKNGVILYGGYAVSETAYTPTLVYNPGRDALLSKEEVFGPVLCLYPFENVEDALSQANSLKYAFQASVFSKDMDFCLHVANRLNASAVMINEHSAFRVDWMPFGGRDVSGLGLGGIPYSMKDMTREKLIVMKSKYI
jgi:acyl-CoA reductase-like NAD-dependent aldehyde dehydrogenase